MLLHPGEEAAKSPVGATFRKKKVLPAKTVQQRNRILIIRLEKKTLIYNAIYEKFFESLTEKKSDAVSESEEEYLGTLTK